MKNNINVHRVIIREINQEYFNDKNFDLKPAMYFNIEMDSYYKIYNKDRLIGYLPDNYYLFFKFNAVEFLEELSTSDFLRLYRNGDKFDILVYNNDKRRFDLLNSKDIRIEYVDDERINMPFTNDIILVNELVIFKSLTHIKRYIDETGTELDVII